MKNFAVCLHIDQESYEWGLSKLNHIYHILYGILYGILYIRTFIFFLKTNQQYYCKENIDNFIFQ